MRSLLSLFLVLLLTSCSSTKKEEGPKEVEHKDLKKDYVVRDSSSDVRPGWVENPEVWAKEYGQDTEKYRYFAFETEPKVSREIACNLAKANARADIAGEISAFIEKSLGESQQGKASIDPNSPSVQALREYVENTLAEKVQAMVNGAEIFRTYWETRQFMQKMGAARDYKASTCGILVRMETERLKKAVSDAANHVVKEADDPKTQEAVKQALESASENFVKAKKGEI